MSGYLARFKTEFADELASDNSDNSRQKVSQTPKPDLLSPSVPIVRGTEPVISFHDCVERLLRPGQIPTDRTFKKATVIWLDEARKRRGLN
jgi:hypothetical protein